jgi:diguanylate cyclase (GGDEF)-like protein
MNIVLTIIALQQGLFAVGWWVAGSLLGLSRRAANHWVAATLFSALALMLIVKRGQWPDWMTIVLANVLAMGAFLVMRRGIQVFLRLPTADREAGLLMAGVLVGLGAYVADRGNGRFAVLATSALIAWTLLRCAFESHRALRASGDGGASRVVAAPFALLGVVYAVRVAAGLLRPEVAAQPLDQANGFNGGVVIMFMVVGLLLNMVLAYLVANRLVRRLHHLSIRDPLTGLLNRRGLAPRLTREAARLRRYGEHYALLAVDVDHFKAVNDRHGHATGDAVLVQLGALLRDMARDVDTVARLGGEEFCLLLPQGDLAGARLAAERLCHAVRQAVWPQVEGPLTVSVGVALASGRDENPQAVLARADAALLRAKASGRDRVVLDEAVP